MSEGPRGEYHPANERGIFTTAAADASPYARYLGTFQSIYCGYAGRDAERAHVASGGIVTSLLAFALRSGVVDGVAVSRISQRDQRIGYDFAIVTDPDEVQSYGTSAYFNIPVERHWNTISEFSGRVALSALPCHTSILRHRQAAGRVLRNVQLFISLFCGHNNELELVRFVLNREGIDERQVTHIRVDRTYLGGSVLTTLKDESIRAIPFRRFNVYRSLWLFSKPMCRYCDDHLGAMSDLSVGDVFTREYRSQPIKHSAMIVRTETGRQLVESAISAGALAVHSVDPSVIFRAQKRIVVPSHDLQSRYLACRTVGFPARKPEGGRFRLRSYITYTLLMVNDRLSRRPWGLRLIGNTPRPLLYAYIAAIKLLNNSLRPQK